VARVWIAGRLFVVATCRQIEMPGKGKLLNYPIHHLEYEILQFVDTLLKMLYSVAFSCNPVAAKSVKIK
jgi:hypothetical protein